MSKKTKQKPEGTPMEEMGKIMGIHPIRVTRIKRMHNFEDGHVLTESELLKMIKDIYGGE